MQQDREEWICQLARSTCSDATSTLISWSPSGPQLFWQMTNDLFWWASHGSALLASQQRGSGFDPLSGWSLFVLSVPARVLWRFIPQTRDMSVSLTGECEWVCEVVCLYTICQPCDWKWDPTIWEICSACHTLVLRSTSLRLPKMLRHLSCICIRLVWTTFFAVVGEQKLSLHLWKQCCFLLSTSEIERRKCLFIAESWWVCTLILRGWTDVSLWSPTTWS